MRNTPCSPRRDQQGQVGIGAEPAVPQHDVAGLQLRARSPRPATSRGSATAPAPTRSSIPVARSNSASHLATGKPQPLRLVAGLAEVALQLGVVGHREAGAVDEPDPMARASAIRRRWRLADGGGDLLEEPVVDGQGEPLAGLAVGAVGEGPAAEVDDVLAGGVAVEDLEQEQVDGGDGVEDAVPPAMADLAAGLLDGFLGQARRRCLGAVGPRMGMIRGGMGGLRRVAQWAL